MTPFSLLEYGHIIRLSTLRIMGEVLVITYILSTMIKTIVIPKKFPYTSQVYLSN